MFCALLMSGFFMRRGWWVKALLMIYVLPWAVPALPTFISIHWMLNGEWGLINNAIYQLFGIDGPAWLNSRWLALGSAIYSHIWKWMPFWTVILLAGRMAIPQDLYDAAKVDGATGWRQFVHINFPLLANLYLICTLLSTIFSLGDFNSVYLRHRRRAGQLDPCSGDARHPRRLRSRAAAAWRRGGDVGAAADDPAGDRADAQAEDRGGAAMSATAIVAASALRGPRASRGVPRRRRRKLGEAAALAFGVLVVVWTVSRIYNMVMVSLESHSDVFTDSVWPPHPSLGSFWVVITQGYWYLEYFWHQFGNSLYVGAVGDDIDVADRLTGKLLDRPDAGPLRLAGQQRRATDLCDPGVVPGDPVLSDHAELRAGE